MWLQMRKSKIKWIQSYKVVFTICRYVALSQDWVGDSLNLYSRQNFGGETRVGDDIIMMVIILLALVMVVDIVHPLVMVDVCHSVGIGDGHF